MLLRLTSSERFSKWPFFWVICEKYLIKFICIYSNIVPYFLLPASPPTLLPVQLMLKKMHVLFSSFWVILIRISLASYFRPKPTVSCEKKRKDYTGLPEYKGSWENGQGCSAVPTFHHPPHSFFQGKKRVGLKS